MNCKKKKMKKMPHSATFRGKRVYIKLMDGTTFIDRFLDRTDRFIVLKDHGRIMKRDLKAFSNYKATA